MPSRYARRGCYFFFGKIMMARVYALSKAALVGAMLGAFAMVLGSALTTSCHSPKFDFVDGEGGMGGEGTGPTCQDGVKNNGETDMDCGGVSCGSTCEPGAACVKDSDCRSLHCSGRVCQAPACDDRILNGDETGTDCGGSCGKCPIGERCVVAADCEAPPDGDPAAVTCKDGACTLNCPDDTGDCNARAADGCEVDLLTSTNHCGDCALDCDPAHAAGTCIGGECLIKTDEPNQGCDTNYANCNLLPEDGCEVNLLTDPEHCGACDDAACSTAGGVPSCSAGECDITCDEGFGDCDDNARDNGCETNTAKNVRHCGKCESVCEVSDMDYTAYCAEGVCGETLCEAGKGDCDGDGACSDSLLTVGNCGGCGQACTVAHGSPDCVANSTGASCAIDVCDVTADEAWADCDGSYVTGCEVNTLSNRFRCGGCLPGEGGSGEDCSLKEGSDNVTATACGAGTCVIVGCAGGYGDCDGIFSNGCETNLDTTAEYCGSCTNDCTDKVGDDDVTDISCASGSCKVDDCASNRFDCDGSFSNGCEVNPNTNATHCGGCNDASGTNCNTKVGDDDVATVQCDAGECAVLTCETGRADCDGSFSNGCEININTNTNNCGACAGQGGDSCEARAHASGSCQAGTCSYACSSGWDDLNEDLNAPSGSDGCESRELTVLNSGTWGSSDTGGSGPPVAFSHTLQGAAGTQRLVLVGVVCRGNSASDCTATTATYGSTQLTLLDDVFLVDSSAQIFYALDSALPAPGSHTVTINRNDEWGSVAADVIEFSGAEQQTFFAAHGGNSKDSPCSDGADAAVAFSNLPAGSVIYAVGGGNGGSGSAMGTSTLSLITSQFTNYIVLGSGYSSPVSGSLSAALDFTGCNRSVLYAVAVRPDTN